MMNTGAHEFFELALDLTTTPRKLVHPLRRVFDEAGAQTAREWAKNARATSGKHGKHYPNSIDHGARFTLGGNIEVEVGPNKSKPQGSMGRGFEFGSVNQPPHLDGVKAFDLLEPRVEKVAAEVIARAIP